MTLLDNLALVHRRTSLEFGGDRKLPVNSLGDADFADERLVVGFASWKSAKARVKTGRAAHCLG